MRKMYKFLIILLSLVSVEAFAQKNAKRVQEDKLYAQATAAYRNRDYCSAENIT